MQLQGCCNAILIYYYIEEWNSLVVFEDLMLHEAADQGSLLQMIPS
jgi:hypothetical protein